ncbi:hypothetical protein RM533_10105 [Croceicoccus sp. F390]|uniref:Uncharacterized protein n=1 Tax=Croceicoccus esteveae TaxID=3075597 RepID=A0ABU2ZJG9_9SPHN|nr:hypothetical protein [Croceicoccus sp. F390]MDT0576540.1 hypothetical protein [Croceicoccus sp. F390]
MRDRKLDKLVRLDLECWRAAETDCDLNHQMINRDIALIRACLNRTVEWKLISSNPLTRVKKARIVAMLEVRNLSEAGEICLC